MMHFDCFRTWIPLAALAVCAGWQAHANTQDPIRRDATVRAIEAVMPSVVNISTETIVEVRDPFDNLFREFFGPGWGRRSQQSLGSGVIIDEEGYILTNLHVVRRANRITVTLADGRVFEAVALVGATKSDVALLKLVTEKNERFAAVKFAPDNDLLLGETVLALGNPFGLGGSVTRGILSSKARRPPIEDESLNVQDWLQTDAAINPGNSGGPLINLQGELIGINVAVYREAQGIGFAIPVQRVSEALGILFTPERIKGLWFGCTVEPASPGFKVRNIEPGSPAAEAGLRPDDVILTINNRTPKTLIDFNRELIRSSEEPVRLTLIRNDARRNLTVRMVPEETFFRNELIRKRIGLTLQPLTPDLAAAMQMNRVQGLLISDIEAGGPADRVQLRPGDVVRAIDGEYPGNIVSAAKLLHAKNPGDTVKLEVIVRRVTGNFVRLVSATANVVVR